MKISSTTRNLIVLGAVVVAAVGLRFKQTFDERRYVTAEVTVGGHVFHAEVADTTTKQELGLGKRDALAPDAAMYFPLGTSSRWIFWMKDMRFPIDIVWIDDGKVVDVSPNAPMPKSGEIPQTFTPIAPADAVLEINAGDAVRYGLSPGADVAVRVLK